MPNAIRMQQGSATSTLAAATDLVKAVLTSHPGMTAEQTLDLLAEIHGRLSALSGGVAPVPSAEASRPAPAVPIEASVTDDHIVCLEDGTKHQMMKRYLKRVHGLTPDEYRARWGLPQDYPMTAPGYSARKRAEAFAVGLGTHENKRGARRRREVAAAA